MKEVFIIGSKGIPARYGGFETFVEKLAEYRNTKELSYHVACMGDGTKEYNYKNVHCFQLNIPNIGPAKAVYYDIKALQRCYKFIKKNNIIGADIYILACRIGPFIKIWKRKLTKYKARILVNPDGHEWKREKWNYCIKRYWKISEQLMVKYADLIICDSVNIENYIQKEYRKYSPETVYIAYGAEVVWKYSEIDLLEAEKWFENKNIKKNEYYLIVGRFVPENNYETIIKEFMRSNTNKQLIIVTNVEKNKFYQKLKKETSFEQDKRIRFVGTVYHQGLLFQIRKNAFAYIHGHEVGGTNPSLLEALGITRLNLLLDVGFNKEVGENGALYWNKTEGNLKKLIEDAENYSEAEIESFNQISSERIETIYNWTKIAEKYEKIFTAY